MITEVVQYFDKAKSRLLSQYLGAPNIEAMLAAVSTSAQELESVFFNLRDDRSIYNATGAQLDGWGQVLNLPRAGLTDDGQYRNALLAKAAQNVSKGTPEDVIIVFRLLMQASYVQYVESYPAKFQLTAIDATPIGTEAAIKSAVQTTKAAGTFCELFASTSGVPFVFQGDSDPNGMGFEDLNNTATGGFFSSIF